MSNLLKKQISLFSLTMIAIGSSIGSGIFRTPSEIAGYLLSEGLMLLVWILGGAIALCGALTFAKIAEYFSKVGGFYVYLKETYGEFPALLYGWSMLIVINTGSTCCSKFGIYLLPKSFFPCFRKNGTCNRN